MKHCALMTLLLSASTYYIIDAALPAFGEHSRDAAENRQENGDDQQIPLTTQSSWPELPVEQYLIEYGYLDSSTGRGNTNAAQRTYNYKFRQALRQFQRENNITPVNGKITPEIITLINHKTEVQIVIDYLKRYNYIQDYDRRYQIPNAIKWLQKNSGQLSVTGVIDSETINFVKSHQRGFAEPIITD